MTGTEIVYFVAGGALILVAQVAQVLYRGRFAGVSVLWFLGVEGFTVGPAVFLISLGVTGNPYFSLVFAGMFTVGFLLLLLAGWRLLLRNPGHTRDI